MITEKQYAEARKWIAENKATYSKYAQIVDEYQSQRDFEQPFKGTQPGHFVRNVFDNFTYDAIVYALPWMSPLKLIINDLTRLSEKEWREAYGIGPVTVAMIKAAVEAAGLKLRP